LSDEQHFARSGFQAKNFAILAYRNGDPANTGRFDALGHGTCDLVQQSINQVERSIQEGSPMAYFIAKITKSLWSAILKLDGMVHGSPANRTQDDSDVLFV
jgi:hypothetical protein